MGDTHIFTDTSPQKGIAMSAKSEMLHKDSTVGTTLNIKYRKKTCSKGTCWTFVFQTRTVSVFCVCVYGNSP